MAAMAKGSFDDGEDSSIEHALEAQSRRFEKRSELLARSLAAARTDEQVQIGELRVSTSLAVHMTTWNPSEGVG